MDIFHRSWNTKKKELKITENDLEFENIEIFSENICFNTNNKYRYHFKELLSTKEIKKIDAAF